MKDHWCFEGSQVACSANSSSPGQSSQRTACTCNPGYIGTDGDMCIICPSGTYKSEQHGNNTNGGSCVECPAGSWCNTGVKQECDENRYSLPGASGQVDCSCVAGYFGVIGSSCEKCPENKVSSEGSTYSTDCVGVPIHVTITFTTTIPVTIGEFQNIRGLYIDGVATALSLDASAVSITDIKTTVMRRRLPQSSINVITAVITPESMVTTVSTSITSGVLQTQLDDNGISVSNISPPVVVVPPDDDALIPSETNEFTGILLDDLWIWMSTGWNYLFVLGGGGVVVLVIVLGLCIYSSGE
jgi:hypothetical protein